MNLKGNEGTKFGLGRHIYALSIQEKSVFLKVCQPSMQTLVTNPPAPRSSPGLRPLDTEVS